MLESKVYTLKENATQQAQKDFTDVVVQYANLEGNPITKNHLSLVSAMH